ncbi:hypothetical protein BA6E_10475 [Bacteroidales bacterium 6E]|nr:hypothetical protein BA6E_10475 [Bacteroidales bacterium 6E]
METSEDFLHFVWGQKLYSLTDLKTTSGEYITVLEPGNLNRDAGPDFFNARLKIDNTIWAGNIEIHQNASDWYKHHHHTNDAYGNVILHIVKKNDQIVYRPNGDPIPTMIIKYPSRLEENYHDLLAARSRIPCESRFHEIDPFLMRIGFNRLMVERLADKTTGIVAGLSYNNNDWEETFYQFLARNFGFKINSVPFELLAKALPLKYIRKHRTQLKQVESLFFGQSGLLHEELLGDDYFIDLRNEYGFLYKKYQLKPIEGHLWKFLRLRPVNFPTLRIAQLAGLMCRQEELFSLIMEADSPEELYTLFDVRASEYWDTHYRFNYSSRTKIKSLGKEAIQNIMINTIAPFLFVYGERNGKEQMKDKALEWLDKLQPEDNTIIRQWISLGVEPRSAFDTQSLIQLQTQYCQCRNCLKCHIGYQVIRHIEPYD